MKNESFSIEFNGEAFDEFQISASVLAQSLLALDGLSKSASEAIYGKDVCTDVKVKSGFRKGSFIVDLVITSFTEDPINAAAGAVTVAGGAVAVLASVIKLSKWAFGKKVKVTDDDPNSDKVMLENELSQRMLFDRCVFNLYNSSLTESRLSRLSQSLDLKGTDSIKIFSDEFPEATAEITKVDREFLRKDEGVVYTDNENDTFLEVLSLSYDTPKKGWRFSEGQGGCEFSAEVDDAEFFRKVQNMEIVLPPGTTLLATVKTVQRKMVRMKTEKTILAVKEVFIPQNAERAELRRTCVTSKENSAVKQER